MNILPSRRSVRAEGEPPAVIALHAGIGSAQEWRPLGERLCFAYRVLAPDLYGYATRWDTPLSLDAEAALIEPLLDAFPGPVYLVGHDYGAAVALKLAHRRRERVAGLVLYEPAAFGLLLADPTSRHDTLEIFVLRRVLARYLDAGDWFRAALRYVDHCSGADAWQGLSVQERATIAHRMPELWARLDAALSDPMAPPGYAGIDVPVLLLTSARSRVSVARIARLLARTLPRARSGTRSTARASGASTRTPRRSSARSQISSRDTKRAGIGIRSRPPPSRSRHLRAASAEPVTGSGRETDRHRPPL